MTKCLSNIHSNLVKHCTLNIEVFPTFIMFKIKGYTHTDIYIYIRPKLISTKRM